MVGVVKWGDFIETVVRGGGSFSLPSFAPPTSAIHPAFEEFFLKMPKSPNKTHKTSQDCETFFYVRWWTFATTGIILIPSLFILRFFFSKNENFPFSRNKKTTLTKNLQDDNGLKTTNERNLTLETKLTQKHLNYKNNNDDDQVITKRRFNASDEITRIDKRKPPPHNFWTK